MLMHSCYCIFISVTGGFVQMLKDFKNLLKMSLKILFIKRKRKIPSIPPLPLIRPHGHFFPRVPSPQPAPQPTPFPLGPASRQQPSRASPAARIVPAQPRRTRQLPRPAADARVPPVGAVPYPARLGNRPLLALQQPPPRRASWARPPVALGLVKRQPSPPLARPLLPPLRFRLVPAATAAQRSPADLRPRRPHRRRLRAISTSDSRPW